MKWTEREYYESSPEAFFYACEGYFDERQELERMMRHIAFINYRVSGGKEATPQRIWPMATDKKVSTDVKVWGDTPEELIRQAMKIHKIDGSEN